MKPIVQILTGHLVDETDVLLHAGDHVGEGVLPHLDGRVGDQDEGVAGRPVGRRHVVYLGVHSWW